MAVSATAGLRRMFAEYTVLINQRLDQRIAGQEFRVSQPCLQGFTDCLRVKSASFVQCPLASHATKKTLDTLLRKPTLTPTDPHTEPCEPLFRGLNLRFAWMETQTIFVEVLLQRVLCFPETVAVVAKEKQVIGVSHIARNPQTLLDVVIRRV